VPALFHSIWAQTATGSGYSQIHSDARGWRSIPVFGDGTMGRDYTFVDDIVAGVRSAIDYEAHSSTGLHSTYSI